MTSTLATRPRSARRDRIRLLVAGAVVVLAGAGVLAGCASLGPALATPVVTSVQGPLPVVQVENSPTVETAELPAEGVAPAALPDFSGSLSAEAIAEAAPVAQAAPTEAVPAESAGGADVEYAGESDSSVAESGPAAPSNGGSSYGGIDFYYTYDGYRATTAEGQALIDACTGGVTEMGSYSIESGAPRTFALHSHCGGDAVTYAAEGSTVAIGSDVYVLGPIVARLSIYEHTSDDVPHGSDALWQSCYNGAADMAFRTLTLIG